MDIRIEAAKAFTSRAQALEALDNIVAKLKQAGWTVQYDCRGNE